MYHNEHMILGNQPDLGMINLILAKKADLGSWSMQTQKTPVENICYLTLNCPPNLLILRVNLRLHQRFNMLISVHIFLKIFTDMLMWISENSKNRYLRQFEPLVISDQGIQTGIGPHICQLHLQIFTDINIISVNNKTSDIHMTK